MKVPYVYNVRMANACHGKGFCNKPMPDLIVEQLTREFPTRGEPLVVHDDGHQIRCFAHVSDVVHAVTRLMDTPQAMGQVFNIGSDQPVSILELAKRVIAVSQSKSSLKFQSYTEAYDADFEDVRRRVPDLSRLKKMIDFTPRYDLDAIIRELA